MLKFQISNFKLAAVSAIFMSSLLSGCQEMVEEVISKTERTSMSENKTKDVVLEDIQKVGNAINELIAKDPKSFQEVFSAVKSRYYLDEMVFVTDLLDESDLYNYEPFVKENTSLYSFRKSFESLKNTIEVDKVNENITLYIPYSENHDFSNFSSITIVTAQEDTDEASGIRYGKEGVTKVSVTDNYAQENLTIIVGINQMREDASTYKDEQEEEKATQKHNNKAYPERVNRVESVTQVMNSKAIMRVHLDAFISTTGNGGGNEMRMARISAYLTPVNGHITNFDGVKKSKEFTRADIKYKRTITVISTWDSNWENDDLEQIYAVYEEDTENTKTFNGSLTTTLVRNISVPIGGTGGTAGGSNTTTGTVGYSVTIKSKDPIVTQDIFKKRDYMLINAPRPLVVGKDCIKDQSFLQLGTLNYWTAYDCGADWSYTLPYEQF